MTAQSLARRKHILSQLGWNNPVSRASWSHDNGEAIVFDAWEDQWERDERNNFIRYLIRSNGPHYNLAESRQNPRIGHTRWQSHVDLLLEGKRSALAIIPVRKEDPGGGAAGWLPLIIDGEVEIDDAGQVWLKTVRVKKTSFE